MYFGTRSLWKSIFTSTAVLSSSTYSCFSFSPMSLTIPTGLKGIDYNTIKATLNAMIEDLDLEEKRHTRAAALSGGQKRRLQLAIAFVGHNKVIFLGM